jgi:hypothetical protein
MFSLCVVNRANALVLIGSDGEVEVQHSLYDPLLRTLRVTAPYTAEIPLWIDCAARTQTRLPLHVFLHGTRARWEAVEITILGLRLHISEGDRYGWTRPLLTLTAQTIGDPW